MSPFLRKVRTSSGATAVQIAVKKHGVRTIVEHLGSAHSDAELAVLMSAGREKLAQGQLAFDFAEVSPARVDAPAVVQGQESRILWQVLCRAYEQLGFDAAVGGDEGFRQMVLARLVEPTSKEDTVHVIGELGVEPVTVRTLFRSLGRCQERSWRENLQQAMFAHAARCGDLSLDD